MPLSPGQSSTGPPINASAEVGHGFAYGPDAYHASSDAKIFSSSMPVLSHEMLKLKHTEDGYQSFNNLSSTLDKLHMDGEDSLEDVGGHAIGSLLPDDEDELLAGIMDDFDFSSGLAHRKDELDEYDLFGSGGGLEMEHDRLDHLSIEIPKVSFADGIFGNGVAHHFSIQNGTGAVAGEHPYGEHPSRTLFVRNINSSVEESELRTLFEQYGDIRTLYLACKHRGFVMISYYDIRAARTAMRALQNKPLRRRKLDIHFSIPKDNPSDKDMNQGTLVVFNLDPSVSNDDLLHIFGAYGEVKEIRETPHKRHHKFVEYYDVRAAEAALRSLNRSDIAGKRIKLEPSRPGGARRNLMLQPNQDFEQDDTRSFRLQVGSSIANSPPGNWPQYGSPIEHSSLHTPSRSPVLGPLSPTVGNNFAGLASLLHSQLPNSGKLAPIGKDHGRGSLVEPAFINGNLNHGVAFQHSHSLPEPKLSQFAGTMSTFGASTESGIETLSGPQFLWGSPNLQADHTKSSSWRAPAIRPSFTANSQYHSFSHAGGHGSSIGSFQPTHHHHVVGSAPSGIPFERQFNQSSDALFKSPPTFGGMGLGHNGRGYMGGPRGSGNTFVPENGSSSFSMMSSARASPVYIGNGHYPGVAPIGMDSFAERGRSRRAEHSANQTDTKKQFQLDLDKILNGEDRRTTLMIKNIPNKYTSKMLLAAIDESNRGTYDFLYLPIDFKNKCNVGYAFINMHFPSDIIPFYQAFNGKKWEKFNSEKVASLAYARIQGRKALVAHFENSSVMNEDKRCRPILFHSDDSEAGDQAIPESLLSSSLNIQIIRSNGSVSEVNAGDSSRNATKNGDGNRKNS